MISLIIGLGNPGDKYRGTRHNLGFELITRLAGCDYDDFNHDKLYDWIEKEIEDSKIMLAMPKTYMNLSGLAVDALLKINTLEPTRILVISDDINLPLGTVRIRSTGSDGGHNGLLSIIETLGTENFPRLRLGIGPLPEEKDQADFVLSEFTEEEIEPVDKMITIASDAVVYALKNNLDEAMTKYNRNPA